MKEGKLVGEGLLQYPALWPGITGKPELMSLTEREKMKTLAQYLAEYIDEEVLANLEHPENSPHLQCVIEQGIKAYQSTENCRVLVFMNAGDPKDCEHCRKCGETTCGNDLQYQSCFEPRK